MSTAAVVVGAASSAVMPQAVMSGVVEPLVWWVMAVLMAAGAVVVVLLGWREQRLRGDRARHLAGAETGRPLLPRRRDRTDCRRRGAGGTRRPSDGPSRPGRQWSVWAGALTAAVVVRLLSSGPGGWLAAVSAGVAMWWWLRRRAGRAREDAVARTAVRAVDRQLPLAAELLAACLTAGSGPAQAAEAVGRSTGGALGDRLVRAAAELRLGAEPAAVWGRFGAQPGCDGLARCMERAGTTGVPPVQAVARLAATCRARRARAAGVRARRAAVLVTGPLGLCFLPAFLAVGVAPVVLGLARSLI
ncbi:type II secretion system F family protein [Streptomyces sp. RKND-216]|uniref:type II secretion system F family protein n=1 Tax=Streptomyces sp. RKND-216 TaxID=2562581 RepID=UPI001FFADFA8|nr:type II secretion system F family protein [Streptomyces sp. RKND-216]